MLPLVRVLRAAFLNRISLLEDLGREFPRIGRAYLGPLPIVIVNDPELSAQVLTERAEDFVKGPVLRVIARPVLGDGLLTSEGDLHRQRRRLVAPAFAHQRIARHAETMQEYTQSTTRAWRDGEAVNLSAAMMRLTLGIVGRTLFERGPAGAGRATGSRHHHHAKIRPTPHALSDSPVGGPGAARADTA